MLIIFQNFYTVRNLEDRPVSVCKVKCLKPQRNARNVDLLSILGHRTSLRDLHHCTKRSTPLQLLPICFSLQKHDGQIDEKVSGHWLTYYHSSLKFIDTVNCWNVYHFEWNSSEMLSSTWNATFHLILNNSVTIWQINSKFGREVGTPFSKITSEGQLLELVRLHKKYPLSDIGVDLKHCWNRHSRGISFKMVHISTIFCINELQTTVINKLISVPILFLQSGRRAFAKKSIWAATAMASIA